MLMHLPLSFPLRFSTFLAQVEGGLGIIQDSIEQLDAVQQAWEQRWTDIFGSANGLYLGINQFAATIVVGAFLFFAVGWVKSAIERGIFPALPDVIWVLAIAALLYNNGAMLGAITLGTRNLINAQTRTVLNVQVGEVSMMEALNDVIVSQQAKALIHQQYAACESKTGQAQIDCFVQAGAEAKRKLEEEYRAKGFWTAGVQRLWARVEQISRRMEQEYNAGNYSNKPGTNPLSDVLVETVMQTGSQAMATQFLKGWQWAFANLLELSMLLTGLMGPIAAAGSIMPLQGRPLWAWLVGFFSLGMAKFSYNVIVGLSATVVVAANAQESGDFGFLLLISVLAPMLALALAGGAGMAVFRGASGGITRIISLSTSVMPIR
jgi:hypothetical protein